MPMKDAYLSKYNNINILAIDLGEKRSGLAFYDARIKQALPLAALLAEGKKRQAGLLSLVLERRPELLLFGLPLHANGELSDQSRKVLGFARRLMRRFPRDYAPKICFINEHASSKLTELEAHQYGVKHERRAGTLDSLVALGFLQESLAQDDSSQLMFLSDFADTEA